MTGYQTVKVQKIEYVDSQDRYDLEVEDNENYFANSILVHNCRAVVTKDGMVAGRSGKPIISAPHIFEDMKLIFEKYPDLAFDGELYADSLAHNFEKLISLAKKTKPTESDLIQSKNELQYHIYDIVDTSMLFTERQNVIQKIFREYLDDVDSVKMVPTVQVIDREHMDKLYAEYIMNGQEGQMIRTNAKYQGKRSSDLLKRKEFEDAEFEILGVIEGQGTWQNMAKSLKVVTPNGDVFHAGIKGTQEYCRNLLENANDVIGKFATIRYQNLSNAGIPRFPVVQIIHETERW